MSEFILGVIVGTLTSAVMQVLFRKVKDTPTSNVGPLTYVEPVQEMPLDDMVMRGPKTRTMWSEDRNLGGR